MEKTTINKDTKIAKAIEIYPQLMGIFLYLSGSLTRLDEEFILKSLGTRTSIAQFAEMENIPLKDLLDYIHIVTGNLNMVGEIVTFAGLEKSDVKPVFLLGLNEENLIELDVRDDILSGRDPINKIKQAISMLNENNAVKMFNVFEPVPLYYIMSKKGITHWSEFRDGVWNIYFYKDTDLISGTTA